MTVLVGYVPTPQGEAALAAGLAEARAHGERVVVINMTRDDKLIDANRAPTSQLDRVQKDLVESGLEHEVRRIDGGTDPAVAIIDAAGQEGARVIVIGLRHRTPVGKLLLGSTAQRILLDAPCPVLAVKPC